MRRIIAALMTMALLFSAVSVLAEEGEEELIVEEVLLEDEAPEAEAPAPHGPGPAFNQEGSFPA